MNSESGVMVKITNMFSNASAKHTVIIEKHTVIIEKKSVLSEINIQIFDDMNKPVRNISAEYTIK